MKRAHNVFALFVAAMSLWVFASNAAAQLVPNLGGQRVGISAYQFLKLGAGARGTAMGQTFVALANDASSVYWNPAGMSQFDDNELLISHDDYIADLQHEFLAGVYHLSPYDAVGLSINNLHTDPIEITTETQPFGTGQYYNYGDLAVALSYGRKMTDQFSFGITGRYVTETLDIIRMNGFMIDLGTYYWTGLGSTRFAVVISNFGPNVSPTGSVTTSSGTAVNTFQDFAPPTQFKMGFAMEPYSAENQHLTTTIELQHPNDNSENLHFAAEYDWQNYVWLRAGVKRTIGQPLLGRDESTAGSYAAGIGVAAPVGTITIHFDYSYSDYNLLGGAHQITLTLGL